MMRQRARKARTQYYVGKIVTSRVHYAKLRTVSYFDARYIKDSGLYAQAGWSCRVSLKETAILLNFSGKPLGYQTILLSVIVLFNLLMYIHPSTVVFKSFESFASARSSIRFKVMRSTLDPTSLENSPSTGARFNRKTKSWSSTSRPQRLDRRMPELPTTAHRWPIGEGSTSVWLCSMIVDKLVPNL